MKYEKICDSGGEHVFPRGEELGFAAPNSTNSEHEAFLCEQQARAQLDLRAFAHTPSWVSLIPAHSLSQDILGTVPPTLRMSSFPWGLLMNPKG